MMIYQSPAMRNIIARAERYARTSATILIFGESGTGKELVARYIHDCSRRHDKPYVCVNCAAFSEQLVESDLFGHEAGAFTGAIRRRPGCFELAGQGTVFLDEIGELPLAQQAKMLRLLEDFELRRVGGVDPVPIQCRLVAATNRHLSQESRSGHFRTDLYHRLSVLTLNIPPLRERKEDIPPLVFYFLKQFQQEGCSQVNHVTHQAMQKILSHDWPGNIRELKNHLQRMCIESADSTLSNVDLTAAPEPLEANTHTQFEYLPLREIERIIILDRIKKFNGNRTEAAAQLGVTTRTLRNKVKQYERCVMGR